MTKVCHLTSAHGAYDDRIFHKECKSLSECGYDVTLIAQNDKSETVGGVTIIPLKKAKNRIHRIVDIPFQILVNALKQNADVYHFHDPELLPVCVLLKIFSGNKIIYDVHEDYSKQTFSKPYLPDFSKKSISLIVKTVEYICSKLFDGIVTATDDILNNFSYHERAISVKNYPILSYFNQESSMEHKHVDNCNLFKIVYAGNISRERGLFEMIQAVANINEPIRLSIYGDYDLNSSENNISKLEGFEKVDFLGWIEHKEIIKLLSKYDVGIVCLHPLTNYITALPIKLFEYMAAGIPVIASNFPILKAIVEDNKCGICVDPLNPKEIANAIHYLMDNEEEKIEMGENGRKVVVSKYNWGEESEKLFKLYEEIIKNKHAYDR